MDPASYADWRSWLKPRRKRGWLALLLIIYILAGFFLVPRIVQQQLPVQSQALIGRTATAEAVAFNPFALRLRVAGLRIADHDAATLAAADELVINLELRSLVRFAIVLGDLELLQPTVYLTRRADGDTNIGRLLTEMDAAAAETPPDDTAAESGMLRLIIDRLRIAGGVIAIEDRAVTEPFATRITPVDISLANLSTLPDDGGVKSISIETENGATITWAGDLTLNPFGTSGRMTVSGSPLGIAHRYLREQLNFRFENCCMDIALDYSIGIPPEGALQAAVDNLDISLREVRMSSDEREEDILLLPELRISGGALRWPETSVSIDSITLDQPVVHAWTDQNRVLNLANLFRAPPATESAPAATDEPASEPSALPDVVIRSVKINELSGDFINLALANPEELAFADANLEISDLSTRPDSRASLSLSAQVLSGGTLRATGSLALAPEPGADLDITLDRFALSALQPWADDAAYIAIDSGSLTVDASLQAAGENLNMADTAITVDDLQISDTRLNEPLAGWQTLQISNITLATAEQRAGIGGIRLAQPFGRLLIDANGGTNFGALAKPSDTGAAAESTAQPGEPFRIRLGKSVVEGGRLDFTDEALPLPFSAVITEFGGNLSAFDTASSELSTIELSGKVGDFGLSTITGELNLTDPTRNADIRAEFRNVSMPETSPYTVEFVGQKIAAGKLDLDLRYRFEDRKVKGDNDIVLRDFELGEKVENPEAMDLPLGLAVGLLRDVNGQIDIDLKVSGDLDDPSFSARNLILKAFANLITKAVAAPFKLLGALVPELGNDNASRIAFTPGSAEVLPPEQEKLQLLATALEQRPGLVLRVPGGVSAELDGGAFQLAAGETPVPAEQMTAQLAELAAQRRDALLAALSTMGLADDRVVAADNGDTGAADGLVTIKLGLEVN